MQYAVVKGKDMRIQRIQRIQDHRYHSISSVIALSILRGEEKAERVLEVDNITLNCTVEIVGLSKTYLE